MNGSDSKPVERRYSEKIVALTNPAGEKLQGSQFVPYPVDEPPVIDVASVDRRWYRTVWIDRGWDVSDV